MACEDSHLLERQYRDASGLTARIVLHRRFGTNEYPWQCWGEIHITKEAGVFVARK